MRFRKGTNDESIWRSVFVWNEYKLPDRFLPSDVIFDIGAHIGSFSSACLERGAGLVVAFEPDRSNYELLVENTIRYGPCIFPVNAAVWRSDAFDAPLYFGGYGKEGGLINTGGGSVFDEKGTQITYLGLDAALRKHQSVSLVKFDCEGSEWPVVATSKLLGERVKAVCGELHTIARPTARMLVEGLQDFSAISFEALLQKSFMKVKIEYCGGMLYHFRASN